MTHKVPGTNVSLLSETDAMGCHSWSLPAGPDVCAGFAAGPGTVCRGCYAAQGRYAMPNVVNAQGARLTWWRIAPEAERVALMVEAIGHACRKRAFFRVFDSGDFTTPDDVMAWVAIARALPNIAFWIPTRSWRVKGFETSLALLASLPNVALRRSALNVDENPPIDANVPLTSGVTSTGPGCPKQTHGSCELAGCRACWQKEVPHIDYHVHGSDVNWKRVSLRRKAA